MQRRPLRRAAATAAAAVLLAAIAAEGNERRSWTPPVTVSLRTSWPAVPPLIEAMCVLNTIYLISVIPLTAAA